jgi:hypothetical protein
MPTYSDVGAAASSHSHSNYLTSHQDISGKANAASVTEGYVGDVESSVGGAEISNIPWIEVSSQGVITSYGVRSHTVTGFASAASITAGTAGTSSATSGSTISIPYVTVSKQGVVTGYGTHTHTVSGFLTSHQDISGKADALSITAGTAGTSSATSGSTVSVPYVTVNKQGLVTSYGTHTHTISGFLTSSSTLDATKLSGTVPVASIPTASTTIGGVKTTSSVSSSSGYTACPIISGVVYYKDTNTWRGIQDNLTSTSTSDSLSANQGKTLKTLIDGTVVAESDITALFS